MRSAMPPLTLSVVMPAHNEAESIAPVLVRLAGTLEAAGIRHEIIVVDDHSHDATAATAQAVSADHPSVRCIQNLDAPGFGLAVRAGLDAFVNDAVAIVMADGSDAPEDVVRCYEELLNGYDCVFGSRFMRDSKVVGYPRFKLIVNRLSNLFVRLLFRIPLNDTTNAFKCYRREVIEGLRPILSNHFNLTVELPLKAIVRGYTFTTIPISWFNRTEGVSKLKLQEMGSRYLFIVLYVWLEKHLAKGDYNRHRKHAAAPAPVESRNPQQPVVK